MTAPREPDDSGPVGKLVRACLVALILLAPLPFGSVADGAVLAIELTAALAGAGALWIVTRHPEALPPRARLVLALPVAVVLAVGILQLIPLPRPIIQALAGPTAEARAVVAAVAPEVDPPYAPLSLSPPDTLDALLRFSAYVAIAVAACVAVRSRAHATTIAYAIVASAAFQALYGSVEYLSGHQHIFGYAKRHYLDSATGTFVNRNHYASFLAMALPFALVGLAGRRNAERRTWRQRILALTGARGARTLLLALAACAIVIGVFLSFSRGGLAAALVGALVALASRMRRRTAAAAALGLFLVPAAWLGWQEVRAPGERFIVGSDVESVSGRLAAWRAASGTAPDYAALGTGLGTFEAAFVMVKPAALDERWTHLHNDWLEALFEGGLPTLLAALAVPAVLLLRRNSTRSSATSAAVAVVAAIGFHSLVDFALRIPANAVLLAIALGLLAAVPPQDEPLFRPVVVPRP